MSKTKTPAETQEFLASIGLKGDGPALMAAPAATGKGTASTTLVQTDVDFHTMPVSDIKFDPALLDEFPDLGGQNFRLASDKLFAMYKSKGRNKDRNGLLHRKITEFIQQVKKQRKEAK